MVNAKTLKLRVCFRSSSLEFLDKKSEQPAKFSTVLKDPDFEKFNFGIKMNAIITGLLMDAKQNGYGNNMTYAALREANTDLYDAILLSKYQKMGS
jgi:hypothetical protein